MVSKRSWNFAGKQYSIPITAYNFSVLRLIDWYFEFHNSKINSKFKIKIYNLKSKFEIQSKFKIPIQNPKFKIYEHAHTNFEL